MSDCKKCKGKGYTEYHDIDGCTIYRWMPYKKRACDCPQGRSIRHRCDS